MYVLRKIFTQWLNNDDSNNVNFRAYSIRPEIFQRRNNIIYCKQSYYFIARSVNDCCYRRIRRRDSSAHDSGGLTVIIGL